MSLGMLYIEARNFDEEVHPTTSLYYRQCIPLVHQYNGGYDVTRDQDHLPLTSYALSCLCLLTKHFHLSANHIFLLHHPTIDTRHSIKWRHFSFGKRKGGREIQSKHSTFDCEMNWYTTHLGSPLGLISRIKGALNTQSPCDPRVMPAIYNSAAERNKNAQVTDPLRLLG